MNQEDTSTPGVIDVSTSPVDPERGPKVDPVTLPVRRHVLTQVRRAQKTLLHVKNLSTLVKFLLEDFPAAMQAPAAELWLHDPENRLSSLAPISTLFGRHLRFEIDSEALYRLYETAPTTTFLSLEDARMFSVLTSVDNATGCVMLPLLDGNRLIGSYHLALDVSPEPHSEADTALLSMLAALCSSSFQRIVEYQRSDRHLLTDPLTDLGNLRAFRRNLQRELGWARRSRKNLAMICVCIDDLEALSEEYGEATTQFVLRRAAQRLASLLRATDYLAHPREGQFFLLLPDCGEPAALATAERFEQDFDQLALEDELGTGLFVTLSIGLACWNPAAYAVRAMEHLGRQLESEAESAMHRAVRCGGAQISVAHLGVRML